MIEPFLFGIVLGMIGISLAGLLVVAFLSKNAQVNKSVIN